MLLVTVVTLGNLFPRKISFLPGMRYYAGNWDTTLWCVKPSADERIEQGARALAKMQHREIGAGGRAAKTKRWCRLTWPTHRAA